MNKELAGGHEIRHETPATAMPDDDLIILADVPLIAEIEAIVRAGGSWAPDFQAKVDAASIALFGVTAADSVAPYPDSNEFYHGRTFDEDAFKRALDQHEDLNATLWTIPADEADPDDVIDWWAEVGVSVTTERGELLRCLSFFEKQLNAAVEEELGASLTLDGSGQRAPLPTETWGASLAAEAAKFISRPRR